MDFFGVRLNDVVRFFLRIAIKRGDELGPLVGRMLRKSSKCHQKGFIGS